MKKILSTSTFLLVFVLFSLLQCSQPTPNPNFITSDIGNFWEAFDKITTTKDSALQYQYLQELFLDKGTPGLEGIMAARRYTPKSYIDAINNYPKFWASIRENTLKSKSYAQDIETGVDQLRKVYPNMKPGKVYFTMGVFRTPGTTIDSIVLIGTEMATGDPTLDVSEFPEQLDYVKNYYQSNPVENIVFLNVHEFVHTQQNNHDYILLYRTIYEGVAEFVAVQATGKASTIPAIQYGKENEARVKDKFISEMLTSAGINNWLYNNTNNEFGTRDLGYYVGYAICEGFYNNASNKAEAIKTMIELDYNKPTAIRNFVDKSGYFSQPMENLEKIYEEKRPKVVSIQEFENGTKDVDPSLKKVTVFFSQKMNIERRGFEFGPLGQEHVLSVKNFLGFAEDGKSMSFEISLTPNKQFQVLLSAAFQDEAGNALKPYLIDITTSN